MLTHRVGLLLLVATALTAGCASQDVQTPASGSQRTQAPTPSSNAQGWTAGPALMSDLLQDLPAVDPLPPLSENLSIYRIEGTIIACGPLARHPLR